MNITEVYTKVYPLNTTNLFYSEKVNTSYVKMGAWHFKPSSIKIAKTKDGKTIINTTSFSYDIINQRLVAKITEPDSIKYRVEERYVAYYVYGHPQIVVLRASGLADREINYQYGSNGQFVTLITNPEGLGARYTYESKYGNKLQDISNSLTTNYTYDHWGNLTKINYHDGTVVNKNLRWAPAACEIYNSLYYTESYTNTGASAYTFYDALGRETGTYTYTDFAGAYNIYTDIRYGKDLNGNDVVKKSLPYNSVRVLDDNKQWIVSTYDLMGRIVREKGPYLDKSYSYGVRTITETNHLDSNRAVTKEYDLLGNLVKATDVGGAITYTYNAQSLPVTITAAGQTTTMAYDLLGRRISIKEPNAGIITSQYNAHGELIKQTNADGNYTTYTYDRIGRVLTKQINGNSGAEGSATYQYDSGNNARGRLSSVTSANHNTSYAYNSNGQLSMQTETIAGSNFSTSYLYYTDGRLKRTTYPSGYYIEYIYNQFGEFYKIVNSQGSAIYELKNTNLFGQVTSEIFGNGLYTLSIYNPVGMQTAIKTGVHSFTTSLTTGGVRNTNPGVADRPIPTFQHTASDNSIQNLIYTYDTLGLMKSRANGTGYYQHSESFKYDKLKRLNWSLADWYGPPVSIEYDNANGNIMEKSDVGAYQYSGPRPHAVTTVKPSFWASVTDNLIPVNTLKTSYTPFNKIKSIQLTASASLLWIKEKYDLTYGHDQQRVQSKEWSRTQESQPLNLLKTTTYINDLYEEEKNEQTGVIRKLHYIKADGKTIAIFVKETNQPDKMYYIHTDHLGSYDIITYNTGTVVDRLNFDAWGNRRNPLDWKQRDTSTTHLFTRGFTGHEHLDKFKVINMNGRLYDPTIGRFFSPDPFVQASASSQGFNRYSYCMNNPLMYTDPSGEFVFTALLPGVGVFIDAACWGAVIGGAMGGVRGAMTEGMTFWDGLWRGAVVGGVGGLLSPIGGGGLGFGWNLLIGTGAGAGTGVLDAALWGTDILQGMGWGALSGAVFTTLASDEFKNLTKGKGFKSNESVFENFKAGKYAIPEESTWQQEALNYFGFEGKYNPNLTSQNYQAQDYWGAYNLETGQISYGNLAFEDFATLKGISIKEIYHSQKILGGMPIEKLPTDMQGLGMDTYLEEVFGYVHMFKQQGLFFGHNLPMQGVEFYQFHLRLYKVPHPTYPNRFQWLYKIPRKW